MMVSLSGRDGYSRVSLVLQSFPTSITFSRAVTQDTSKCFYYSKRHSVSRVIRGKIFWSGLSRARYVRLACEVGVYIRYERTRHRDSSSSSTYVGDVRFRERNIGVRLKIPVFKACAPAQSTLRPATVLRLHCGRENACPSVTARPLSVRASYIELFPSVSTLSLVVYGLELPIPNRFASSSGNLEERRKETLAFFFSISL